MKVLCVVGGEGAGKSTAAGYLESSAKYALYEPGRVVAMLTSQLFKLETKMLKGWLAEVVDPLWQITPATMLRKTEEALVSAFGPGIFLQRCLLEAAASGSERVVLDGVSREELQSLRGYVADGEFELSILVISRRGVENPFLDLDLPEAGIFRIENPAPPGADDGWYTPFAQAVLDRVPDIEARHAS